MASKLEILITAQNAASKDILKLQKDINSLTAATATNTTGNAANTTSTKAMGASMATAGAQASALRTTLISLGGIVLFAAALRNVVQFEQAMANVRAVMLSVEGTVDDVDASFTALSDEARRLGATTVFSATQAANGLEFLGRAGFSASEAVSALEGTLNLAAAGGLGLGRAADIASNILAGFALNANEAGRVADVLALAAASSNTSVEQLGEAMKFVAPISSSLGASIETTAAAIGKLSDAGLQGSLAGTGLRKVLLKLAAPSKKLNVVLDDLGLSFDQVNTQTNDLSEIMALFEAQGLSAAQAIDIFGDRGAPAALAMKAVSAEMGILNDQLDNAIGQAEIMSNIMQDTLSGAFKALTSALTETVLQMGDDGLGAALRNTIDLIAGVVRVLNGTADPLHENAVLFRQAADAVEALWSILKILIGLKIAGFFVGSIAAIFRFGTAMFAAVGGVNALSISVRGLGLALAGALGPIGLLISLGVAMVAFATSDAPQAIAALEETAEATERLTAAFDKADAGRINAALIKANIEATSLNGKIEELQDQFDKTELEFLQGKSGGFEAEQELEAINAEIASLESRYDLTLANIETLEKLKADADVREAEAKKEQLRLLEKLEAEAAQNELAAVTAQGKALDQLALKKIEQDKKLAKARTAIKLDQLRADFEAERAFLEGQTETELEDGEFQEAQLTNAALIALEEEFFAEKRRLAEEQIQFDLQLIQRERAIQEEATAEEIKALQDFAAIQIGNSGEARERAALEQQLQARIDVINAAASVELQTLADKGEAIRVQTIAAQQKLTTEEAKVLLDRQNSFADAQAKAIEDNETAQKKAFDDRIQAIVAQAERERNAAQRDVDTGAESGFGLGDRLETIDAEAVEKLRQVKEDMLEFSETAQDPILEERFIALGDVISEFSERANVNLERIKTSLATGLGDALFEIVDGTKSAQEAFTEFARSFLREIAQMILQQIALNAVKAAFGGFSGGGGLGLAGGGYIGAATGGYITGKGTSTSDSIPARLSNGEYVVNADAVKGYGLNFMEAINRMKLPQQAGLPKFAISRPRRMKFADGGVVDSGAGQQGAPQPQGLRIINVVDTNQAADFLASSDGEEVVLNLIQRNGSKVKQYLQ